MAEKKMKIDSLTSLILWTGILVQCVSGQSTTDLLKNRDVKAIKLNGSKIHVDGLLSETVWRNTSKEGDFTQRSPEDGVIPFNATYFTVVYDEENLYFGVWANDSDPENIDAILTRRDEGSPSDWVYVSIDSFNDNRTAFEFGLNAAGVKQDLRRFDDDNLDYDWDGVWEGEVHRTPDGWTAEFEIPFRELRFNTGDNMVWGLQVYREFPRNSDELSVWNYWSKEDAGFVSNYGKLTALRDIKSEKPLYLIPYVVGKNHINSELKDFYHSQRYDLLANTGADVRYSFGNGLTLNATINPDFGQVESDPADFNLTEFETYFSEKRPFFVEGGNILKFSMGFGDGDNGNNTLVYSRRIGSTPFGYVSSVEDSISATNPVFVDILTAVKLTGKTEDGLSLGLMDAVTNEERAIKHLADGTSEKVTVEPLTNYHISRLQKDFRDGQTVIGGIITAVNRNLEDTGFENDLHKSAYSGGLDMTHEFFDRNFYLQSALSFSRVAGTVTAITNTQMSSARYFQRPDADHLSLDTTATSLSGYSVKLIGGKSRGHYQGAIGILASSPGFEVNDLGFNRNSDYYMQFIWLAYRQWNPGNYLKTLNININQGVSGDFAPEINSFGGNINFNTTLLSNAGFGGGINANAPGFSTTLLRGGPAIATPANGSFWINYWTDWRAPVSYDVSTSYFSNTDKVHSADISQGISLRPWDNFQISLNMGINKFSDTWAWRGKAWDENDVIHYIFSDLDQSTILFTMRTNYTITTSLSLQFYSQYYSTAGKYSGFREADQVRERNFDSRLKKLKYAELEFGETTQLSLNNFSEIRYSFYNGLDGDFTYQQFRSNLVLRWEFQTGSMVYFVWSNGYTNSMDRYLTADAGNFDLGQNMKDLWKTPGDNVLLIKFSYLFHI